MRSVDIDAFQGLAALGSLQLTNGYLQKAPSLQHIRETITTLNLDNNHIGNLDSTYFAGCVKLKTIYLRDNLLSVVPDINYIAPSITTLQLERNRMNELHLKLTRPFPRLYQLYLSGNNMSAFCTNQIEQLVNLQVLGLESNNITQFDFKVMLKRRSKLKLELRDNPLGCKELAGLNKTCRVDKGLVYVCERSNKIKVSGCVNYRGERYLFHGDFNPPFAWLKISHITRNHFWLYIAYPSYWLENFHITSYLFWIIFQTHMSIPVQRQDKRVWLSPQVSMLA